MNIEPGNDPNVVFEKVFSATASRKLGELVLDRSAAVQSNIPAFLEQVGVQLTSSSPAPTIYEAMSVAGSALDGLGPPPAETFATLYHAAGAQSFYETNVSLAWKQQAAVSLGLPPTPPSYEKPGSPVYVYWEGLVGGTGAPIPLSMLEPTSTGAWAYSWWSPDARMNLPSSATPEQGNDDFFAICQIVSLAPEWYPYGLVCLTIADASSVAVVRPTPYDGMTSPLWVQRPPNRLARTGGGALETLLKGNIQLSQLGPVQVYIISSAMQTALAPGNAAQVDNYAPDLRLVKPGDTAESRRVASMQVLITEECRASRAAADHEFAELILKVQGSQQPTTEESVSKSVRELSSRSAGPPATTASPLVAEMERWGRLGLRRHRGDRFPSDRFSEEARQPGAAQAIYEAATELLRTSDDPGVVRLVLNIRGVVTYRPFFDALLERLEGRGLPDGVGQRSATIRDDGLIRLTEALPPGDAALALRVHEVLERAGRSDLRLLLYCREAPGDEVEALLPRVAAQPGVDPNVLALAAMRLAQHRPDRLLPQASHFQALDVVARRWILDAVRGAAPGWFAQHGAELEKVLGLAPAP
jgi:hypothetical protein